MPQKGEAGGNLIQVGRDYLRYLQINIQGGNWLIVLGNVAFIFFITGILGTGLITGVKEASLFVKENTVGKNSNLPSTTSASPSPTTSASPSPTTSASPSPTTSASPSPTTSVSPSPEPTSEYKPVGSVTIAEFSQWAESQNFVQGWELSLDVNSTQNCSIGAALSYSLLNDESHTLTNNEEEKKEKYKFAFFSRTTFNSIAVCPIIDSSSNQLIVGYKPEQEVVRVLFVVSVRLASIYEERNTQAKKIIGQY